MGCCSPNYHKQVSQKEEKVNKAEKDKVPLWLKMISTMIVIVSLGYYLI